MRTRRDEIVSLISYAVGCMFGRYSLDVDGLVLANQGDGLAQYLERVPNPTFMPNEDDVLVMPDDEYFSNDAAVRFVEFVRTVYGEETLEENLRYIADTLTSDGWSAKGSPREVIRTYFIKDFFADHCQTYKKRPIYWQLDSGKKNGFKALIYIHRYTPDLMARVRTDYVHELQERYRTQIAHLREAENDASGSQRARISKQLKKLTDQAAEIASFEEKIHDLADHMIALDLDDGVKVNYAKLQPVLTKIK